jgi:hypothetical protein
MKLNRTSQLGAGQFMAALLLLLAAELVLAKAPFGGPGSVESQIAEDALPDKSHTGTDLLKEWKDYKVGLKERTGFSLNTDYTAYYLAGSGDFGPSEAGSGIFRIYGSWDLVGRGTENPTPGFTGAEVPGSRQIVCRIVSIP